MKKYFANKSFLAGFSLICFFALLILTGFFYLPYDPDFPNTAEKFAPFSARHLLGTDHLGRDVFSRILLGARISFEIGFVVMLAGFFSGLLLGSVSGYFGGILDLLIQKMISVLMSFPGILLALMLIAVFGTDERITVLALCLMSVPRFTRITRASFLKYKTSLFVKSARSRGAGHLRIMIYHILPNILPELLVTCSLSFALAILGESGLSYLGIGIQPPTPSFGRMLNDAQRFIFRNPAGVLVPAFFLTLLVLGFNLLGDGISETAGGEPKEEKDFHPDFSEKTEMKCDSASSSKKALFQIKNLSVGFSQNGNQTQILDDVSLSVDEGEFVALVGESGSGKTMTSLAAMHLLPENIQISGGEVILGDKNLSSMSESEFRAISGKEISMIFQEPMTSLNPLIKVGKQIEEAAIVHGFSKKEAKKRSFELSRLTGLSDTERVLSSFPHELSGGMKQRIMITSALINHPKLLIADEPTTALDVSTQEEIIHILQNLRQTKNIAMLLITHDFSVVRKLCSRVYIMYRGKIVEQNTVEEIFKNPQHDYTKALIDSIPNLDKKGEKLPVYDAFFTYAKDS